MNHPPPINEILDRSPPADIPVERAVLGSILLQPEVLDDVALLLDASDFWDDANATLYRTMRAMHDAGKRLDAKLLIARLKKDGEFEKIGGTAYLGEIMASTPTAAHATSYATIVAEHSKRRALIQAGTEMLHHAYNGEDVTEQVARAEQSVFAISERTIDKPIEMGDVLMDAMASIDEGRTRGISMGWKSLDTITGGLRGSELTILAARPGDGKSAFALCVARHVALTELQHVLFCSLEMARMELADRLLSLTARVDGRRMRGGYLNQEERQKLVTASNDLSGIRMTLDDAANRTVSQIAAMARRLKRRKDGLGLIVIDYLQLVTPDDDKVSREQQVSKVSRRLKGLAKELGVPILCLAQLNRRADLTGKPQLSHLRESGAIEQDADCVMFIHHETDENDQRTSQIIVAKQRNGPTGEIGIVFHAKFTRFEEQAPKRHDEFDDWNDR